MCRMSVSPWANLRRAHVNAHVDEVGGNLDRAAVLEHLDLDLDGYDATGV